MVETNAITTFSPSENRQLATALTHLEEQFEAAAEFNIAQVGDGFTQAEKIAMKKIEELRLLNGMDLAAVLLRGKLLREIEDMGLWSNHPSGYGSLEECARAQGVSLSELSQTRDLCNVIFPYVEETLQVPIAQMWENIGKSGFRELVPVLKAIITGTEPAHGSTREAYERFLNDAAAGLRAAGNEPSEEEVQRQAVSDLLTAGEQMPVAQLRRHVRPERTPAPTTVRVNTSSTRYLIMKIDSDEQEIALQRKLGSYYLDAPTVELPDDPRRRQVEATRVALIREINSLVER